MDKLNLYKLQKKELTEHYIYKRMSEKMQEPENKKRMKLMAKDDLRHAKVLQKYTKKPAKPYYIRLWLTNLLARILGYTFMLRLRQRSENKNQTIYQNLLIDAEDKDMLITQDKTHETMIIETIEDDRVTYIRAIVLGLNDALVELSGALAGLTFAIANTEIISITGLITGIAAAMSMAASEYLSSSANNHSDALKSSVYTGISYIIVVIILILPYLILDNRFIALGIMLSSAMVIIFLFNYFMCVAMQYNFKRRFTQMAIISLGIAFISFIIGTLLGMIFNVDI